MELKAAIRKKPSQKRPWTELLEVPLSDIKDALEALESTNSQRVVSVSYGRGAKGGNPSYPTLIEIAQAGPDGRSKSWTRLLIYEVRDAKPLMVASPKVLKFLGATPQSL